jgi:hypothetical protein
MISRSVVQVGPCTVASHSVLLVVSYVQVRQANIVFCSEPGTSYTTEPARTAGPDLGLDPNQGYHICCSSCWLQCGYCDGTSLHSGPCHSSSSFRCQNWRLPRPPAAATAGAVGRMPCVLANVPLGTTRSSTCRQHGRTACSIADPAREDCVHCDCTGSTATDLPDKAHADGSTGLTSHSW